MKASRFYVHVQLLESGWWEIIYCDLLDHRDPPIIRRFADWDDVADAIQDWCDRDPNPEQESVGQLLWKRYT